jgi:hypothetical protein
MHHSPLLKVLAAASIGSLGLLAATSANAAPDHHHHGLHVATLVSGTSLEHTFVPAGSSTTQTEPLSHPDDLAMLGGRLFVAFQNGVGPQGEPSTATHNTDSTVVELTLSGRKLRQWDVTGKVDGLGADPWLHGVVATVNEDANSSLDTIQPWATTPVTQYSYNEPLPHAGGTDAVTVVRGRILVSASAPGTSGPATAPTPAVYVVSLDRSTEVATITTLFNDQDTATVANVGPALGQSVTLGLTDPDSSVLVPFGSPRFAGDFELTSQGDLQQIYVSHAGTAHQALHVLNLSQSVDDTAWPSAWRSGWGRLVATDSTNDAVDVITGDFGRQPLVVATPCGANMAPATCSDSPPAPANYLAALDLFTGRVTPVDVHGVAFVPQGGLLYMERCRLAPGHRGKLGSGIASRRLSARSAGNCAGDYVGTLFARATK